MVFSKEFYTLNLAFARQVQRVSRLPAEYTLRFFTNLYVRFGLGTNLLRDHPVWQEYLCGLASSSDEEEWTYRFALEHDSYPDTEIRQPGFGCFSYTLWDQKRIRLHFHNEEPGGISPLSKDRMVARQDELHGMFYYIKEHAGAVESVIGGSWLYSLEAYRRLFPAAFLSTARPGGHDYPYLTLWGQFLDHLGQVRGDLASNFIECSKQQSTLEGILGCFPFKVQYLEAPSPVFYQYYGIE